MHFLSLTHVITAYLNYIPEREAERGRQRREKDDVNWKLVLERRFRRSGEEECYSSGSVHTIQGPSCLDVH